MPVGAGEEEGEGVGEGSVEGPKDGADCRQVG